MSPELRYAKKILDYFKKDGLQLPIKEFHYGRDNVLLKWHVDKMCVELGFTYTLRHDYSLEFGRTEHVGILDNDEYVELSDSDLKKVENIIWDIIYDTPQSFEL